MTKDDITRIAVQCGWLPVFTGKLENANPGVEKMLDGYEHVILQGCSPDGEDISFHINFNSIDSLVTEIEGYASDFGKFEMEQHVLNLIKERDSGVAYFQKCDMTRTVLDMVDDVRAIKKMLDDLAVALVHARDEEQKCLDQFDPRAVQKEDYEYV